jgi:hypothetical protein
VRLGGLGQLKNPMTSSGIETVTFRLVAQCLNQLRYRKVVIKRVYCTVNHFRPGRFNRMRSEFVESSVTRIAGCVWVIPWP